MTESPRAQLLALLRRTLPEITCSYYSDTPESLTDNGEMCCIDGDVNLGKLADAVLAALPNLGATT